MQRARRLLCSRASASSPSNTTLRTRRSSRTSSAGGDGFAINKNPRNVEHRLDPKMKPRATKHHNMRLVSSNLRNSRKMGKPRKSMRPSLGSLQHTIVLAPFHTLKRCFQSKLVDLYSQEKLKKMNHNIKMAKKHNMAFEYDVLEMKPFESKQKKKGTEKRQSPKQKSRSKSYCQCNKSGSRTTERNPKATKRTSTTAQLDPFIEEPSCFRDRLGSKRSKNRNVFTPNQIKVDTGPRLNLPTNRDETFYRCEASNTNSASAVSSRSRIDSWETLSDSPSCRAERLEGCMAISTTSFDSCLERFDRESCHCSETCHSYKSRLKTLNENNKNKSSDNVTLDANFIPKPNVNDSRHMIMNVGKRNSDGQITDFMDREPQSHGSSSMEVSNHLQPLRRQSKTKTKKQESDSGRGYYLRSRGMSKEKITSGGTATASSKSSTRGGGFSRRKSFNSEVTNQVEEVVTGQQETIPTRQIEESKKPEIENQVLATSKPEESSVVENPSSDPDKSEQTPLEDNHPSCESSPIETPEPERDSGNGVWAQDSVKESGGSSQEEVSGGMIPRPEGGLLFQESSDPERNANQPEDKDSVFIFGRRNTPTRLGESCEFSFGLNWDFSDEDSDLGDRFF